MLKKTFFFGVFLFLTTLTIAQTPISLCPMSTSFSSMSRGYHFTAPCNFTICGLYVPDDISTGSQTVEVVRFTAGAPPAFSSTTNSFVSLFYQATWAPNTMIPCNITVNTGDIIGVYGCRTPNSTNSYGQAACPTTIMGNAVTLYRSGMQYDLATQQMHDIWSEVNYYIGRVFMYINCCPTPDFTIDSMVCLGDTATATYIGSGVPPSASFNWTFNGGTPATANTIGPHDVTWATAGVKTVTLDVSQAACPTVSDTQTVTVLPLPVAFAGVDTSICLGDSVGLLASGGATFLWSNGVTTANTTVTPTATTTYTVTVSNGICSGTDDIIVTVNPLPVIAVTNDTVCNGNQGSLLASGASTYLWSNLSNANPLTITPTTTTSYTVTGTDVNGCSSTGVGEIYVIDYPNLSISSTDAHCSQSDGSVTVIATGGTGSYTYSWNTTPTSTSSSVSNVPAGTYTVTVSNDGCDTVSSVIVANIPGPTASFILNPTQAEVNQTVMFTDMSTGATSWYWNLGDGGVSVLTNPTHSYSISGTYTICLLVTDNFGCEDSTCSNVFINGLFTMYIPNAFSPDDDGVNEVFMPQGIGIDEERYIMQIFDRWGKKVFETTDILEGWDGRIEEQEISNMEINTSVYSYYIKVFENNTDISHEYRGNVTLLR